MPLYEYECQQCRRRIEKIQKFSDPELTTCPHCGGRLERTLNAPAISFKGGGWYADLYSSAKPAAGKSDKSEASASSSSSEGGGAKSDGSASSAAASSSASSSPALASAPSTPSAPKK